MIIETNSDKDTFEFGKQLGEKAEPGTVICLDGDLGTGKTVIAKGIAAGLGVKEPVSSPTFTVIKEYTEGRLPFYHFDVYRVSDPDEMEETGFFDFVNGDGVTLIEWAELIEDVIPKDAMWVTIEKDNEKGFDYRKITVR